MRKFAISLVCLLTAGCGTSTYVQEGVSVDNKGTYATLRIADKYASTSPLSVGGVMGSIWRVDDKMTFNPIGNMKNPSSAIFSPGKHKLQVRFNFNKLVLSVPKDFVFCAVFENQEYEVSISDEENSDSAEIMIKDTTGSELKPVSC